MVGISFKKYFSQKKKKVLVESDRYVGNIVTYRWFNRNGGVTIMLIRKIVMQLINIIFVGILSNSILWKS